MPKSRNDGIILSDKRESIFDEKSGLRSHEQGNKTKASIDEASGKSPRFIAPSGLQGVSRSKKDNRAFSYSL